MSKYRGPRLRLVRIRDLPGLTRKVSNKPNTQDNMDNCDQN
jgi:hypothetical protein